MRRIKKAKVKRLALCKRGKNGLTTLFKSSKEGLGEWTTLVKATEVEETGELLAVAYPFDMPDADGDFADTMEVIEGMAHSFLKEGAKLDIEHDGEVLDPNAAYVKESFVIQPGDERFADWPGYDGKPVDVTGGWAVKIQIDDPELRAAYRDGDWDGVSLFGPAAVEQVDSKVAGSRVAARLGKSAARKKIKMDKEELTALLKAFKEDVVELIKTATAPKEEVEDTGKQEVKAPVFEGDITNPEDLEAFEKSLAAFEMGQKIASGDLSASDVAEMRKSLQETQPSVEDLQAMNIPAHESDTPEVRALQVRLAKSMKRSNASGEGQGKETQEDLKKSQWDLGKEIADMANERAGARQSSNNFQVTAK